MVKDPTEQGKKNRTMSHTGVDKAIRVIPFTGKKEDWRMWSRKFLARAKTRGYKTIINGTEISPKSTKTFNETTPRGRKMIKLQEANHSAYNDMLLSYEEEVSFGLVDEAITSEYPDGDARQAWKNLLAKFESTTMAMKKNFIKKFVTKVLGDSTEDPDELITNLERLRQ